MNHSTTSTNDIIARRASRWSHISAFLSTLAIAGGLFSAGCVVEQAGDEEDSGEASQALLTCNATWSTVRQSSIGLSPDGRTAASLADHSWVQSGICKSSGKWYVEVKKTASAAVYPNYWTIGVASSTATAFSSGVYTNDVSSIFYYPQLGIVDKQTGYAPDATQTMDSGLGVAGVNDVVGISLDMDSRQITFHTPTKVSGPHAIPGVASSYCIHFGYGHGNTVRINAGQDAFAYAVPTGFSPGLSEETQGSTCGGSQSIGALSAGNYYSVTVKPDGTVWSAGLNDNGQLGDGTLTTRTTPVQMLGMPPIIAAATNYHQTVMLASDGTVWATGRNDNGQLGDGTFVNRTTPVKAVGLSGIIAVQAAGARSYALKSDGTVWGMGSPGYGGLGPGVSGFQSVAVQIQGLSGITAISSRNNHAVALKSDGTVWTWGYNGHGELGDGTTTNRTTPVQAIGLSGIIAISAGTFHTVALKSDGTVWSTGLNSSGTLGDGTLTNRTIAVQMVGLAGVMAISAGFYHTLTRKADGTVWGAGQNIVGELGDGTTTNRNVPVQMNITGVIDMAGGQRHSLLRKADGKVWGTGSNTYGEIGYTTPQAQKTPVLSILP